MIISGFIKITKIVWEASLHESWLVVTSRCFAFRTLIMQTWIWKRFWVENLDKFTLFTNFLVGCQFFFAWADILSEKKPVFLKAFFFKTRTDYAYKASFTRLRDW